MRKKRGKLSRNIHDPQLHIPPFLPGPMERCFSSPFQRLAFPCRLPIMFPSAFSWVLVQQSSSPSSSDYNPAHHSTFLKLSHRPFCFPSLSFHLSVLTKFSALTISPSHPLLSPRTLSAAPTALATLWGQTSAMPRQLPFQGPCLTILQFHAAHTSTGHTLNLLSGI